LLNKALIHWLDTLKAMPAHTLGEIELIQGVVNEVDDPEFRHLRHGERHTRNQGCTGPLCQKALRDWQRDRTAARHAERGTTPRPHRRSREMVRVDEILVPVKAAHDAEFVSRAYCEGPEQLTRPSVSAEIEELAFL
jgi:hypothetical protein